MFLLEQGIFFTFLMYTSPFPLTEVHLTPKPALALLLLGINQLPSNPRTVVMHLPLATKQHIARLWYSLAKPSRADMVRELNYQFKMENNLASTNLATGYSLYSGLSGYRTEL